MICKILIRLISPSILYSLCTSMLINLFLLGYIPKNLLKFKLLYIKNYINIYMYFYL